jgi:hypothetical protein
LVAAFDSKKAKSLKAGEKLKEELYRQIGQLKVELDWLKKIWDVAPLRSGC